MNYDRRTLLRLSGLAAAGALAGCTSSGDTDTLDGEESPTPVSGTDTPGESAPPGADELGGLENLQSSAEIRATTLDSDQGAGQFVFSPAVVWVEPGATVSWSVEAGSHSATAYHSDNDKPHRVPEGSSTFDSGVLGAGGSFEHTFETEGVYNYYCTPHESLGMVGLVIVGSAEGGPGTTSITELSGTAASNLERLLTEVAGLSLSGGSGTTYGWEDGTWDAYWYSLYNMSTNIAMSGNGITFPANADQQATFEERLPAMLEAAGQEMPPVKNPNLNMAPFTAGDPHFTQEPVLEGEDGRPDASTLQWDPENSSKTVSPASLAWTHLKGVTWAKNFENHFDILPDSLAAEFRSMLLTTMAQVGTVFALVSTQGGGNLRLNDDNMLLAPAFRPGEGIVEETPRPTDHAAMLWFLADLTSLAQGGWFGYENPEPLIPAENIQMLTDGVGRTTMNAFAPGDFENTRDVGLTLGALGWYGTHAGSTEATSAAAEYANTLADHVESNLEDNGRVANGASNQAATQGVVGQGLAWASQVDGVDRTDSAGDALGYLVDELWDDDAGTFASGTDASTYAITARDAGDITGGLNAADAELGMDVNSEFARFFDQMFNRGRLQRAERPPSRDENAEHTLPLPPAAGGEYGQAAVYNAEVEYDPGADEWSVTDPTFDTEAALYLSNQDIWVSQWGGEFFQGRGVPGTNDTPE
jgi:plastocyanin